MKIFFNKKFFAFFLGLLLIAQPTSLVFAQATMTDGDDPYGLNQASADNQYIQEAGGAVASCATSGLVDSLIGSVTGSSILNTVPVNQPTQDTKEFTLDCVARAIAQAVIQGMTQSLVGWINNGFQGAPLFLDDPLAFFASIEDDVTGALIEELGLGDLCSISGPQIRLALELSGTRRTFNQRYHCSLREAVGNISGIFNDFSHASLDDFVDVYVYEQNNPFDLYLAAKEERDRRIGLQKNTYSDLLNWGDGFLPLIDATGRITLPGKIIEEQLATTLGSEVRQLELADEINEVVAALVKALVNKVFSAAGGLLN